MESVIEFLKMVLVILVFVIFGLGAMYFVIPNSNKKKKDNTATINNKPTKGKTTNNTFAQGNLTKESIYNFMEFDDIKDNMIIRKNRTQYVMVIQCQGVNYDLLSEQEKLAVEEGFVQFLNTLRYPIQLYVQTKSLNLRDIIEEYKEKIQKIEEEVMQIRTKIKDAEMKQNKELLERLKFEERRKVNVLEYGADITEYVGRLSLNKNVLQQKTYIVVPYYTAEFGSVATYSNEEIDGICFSELYTRCQNIIRAIESSEVSGRILDSEELAELLYVAYNRDDSDLLQLSKAIDAQYNALYNTGKDVVEKKKELLDKQIEESAINVVTDSIIAADEKLTKTQEEMEEMIKKRALEIAEEYQEQMEDDLYNETLNQIEKKTSKKKAKEKTETQNEKPKRKITRKVV